MFEAINSTFFYPKTHIKSSLKKKSTGFEVGFGVKKVEFMASNIIIFDCCPSEAIIIRVWLTHLDFGSMDFQISLVPRF